MHHAPSTTQVFGMALLFIFLLVKFDRLERGGVVGGVLAAVTTPAPSA